MDLSKYTQNINMSSVFVGFEPGIRTVELVAVTTEFNGKPMIGKNPPHNQYFQLEFRLPVNPKTGGRSRIWENVTPLFVKEGSKGMDICIGKLLHFGGEPKGNVNSTKQFYNVMLEAFREAIGNTADVWVNRVPRLDPDGKQVVKDGKPQYKLVIDWNATHEG